MERLRKRTMLFILLLLVVVPFMNLQATVAQTPPDNPNIPDHIFDELMEIAQENETVQVIIELNVPFTPAGNLSSQAAVQAQERAIHEKQQEITTFLEAFDATTIANDWFIPFAAFEVNANALIALRSNPNVKGLQLNHEEELYMDDTIPLIQVEAQWNKGFDGGYTSGDWAVAIIDTGINRNHEFFGGRVVSEACYVNAGTGTCPNGSKSQTGIGSAAHSTCVNTGASGCDHGTHVAGIAAGANGDGGTIDGVAPGADIIAIQVFGTMSNSTGRAVTYVSDVVSALNRVYALRFTYNIAASNMSLGGGQYFSTCDATETSYSAAINQLFSVNIASAVASGNNGFTSSTGRPACIANAITVGNTDKSDNVNGSSNSATWVDMLAPGTSIWASAGTTSNTLYGSKTGTSMAAPHVAGAWAVIKDRFPSYTVNQVRSALISNGISINDPKSGLSHSRIEVDLCNAGEEPGFPIPNPVTTAQELVDAISFANNEFCGAAAGADTINIGADIFLGNVTYPTTNHELDIYTDITINADGHKIARSNSAANAFRIFDVHNGHTTLGDLTLNDARIGNGETTGYGGGIYLANVTATINNSMVTGNQASLGGGIYNLSSILTLNNTTVARNVATGSVGGGIRLNGGTSTITNSVIWGNDSTGAAAVDQIGDAGTDIVTYTAVQSGWTGTGNLNVSGAANVFLAPEPLANTPTHFGTYTLDSTSPVINKGLDTAVVSANDIFGALRILAGRVDLGADEYPVCSLISFPYSSTTTANFQKAVACANENGAGNDIINISNAHYFVTMADPAEGTHALPEIASSVTINGNGNLIARSASTSSDQMRLFEVLSSGTLTINDARLARGDVSGNGGAIYTNGTLNLNNVMITGNLASSLGGGIYKLGGTANLENVTVARNEVGGVVGGGIRNLNGDLNMDNSLVWGNQSTSSEPNIAVSSGTVTVQYSGVEGGFAGDGNLDLNSINNVFLSPLAASTAPSYGGNYELIVSGSNPAVNSGDNNLSILSADYEGDIRPGGGIIDMGADEANICSLISFPYNANTDGKLILGIGCANDNGIALDTINVTGNILLSKNVKSSTGTPIVDSRIIINGNGNRVFRNLASDSFRIFNVIGDGNLSLNDMIISGGDANTGYGGGVLNSGITTINNVIVSGNNASLGGGLYTYAALNVNNSTVANNNATGTVGGGIRNNNGTLNVVNSIVWGNDSTGAATEDQLGIFSGTTSVTYSGIQDGYTGTGNLNLSGGDTVFASPQPAANAPTNASNYHLAANSPALNQGSNLDVFTSTDLDGNNRIIAGLVDMGADEVDFCPGISYPYNASSPGQLILAIGCANDNGPGWDTINLTSNIVLDRTVDYLYANTATPLVNSQIIINGNGNAIRRNVASGDTMRLFGNAASGTLVLNEVIVSGGNAAYGGGIFNDGDLRMFNTILSGNASNYGGGLYSYTGDTTTILNSTIAGNYASADGGGIFNFDGTLDVKNSAIWGNDSVGATQIGGGGSSPTTTVIYSGIQDGFAGAGNISIPATATVFINPNLASAAPTNASNYHLDPDSPLINEAANIHIGSLTEDIDGDDRIIGIKVDMGADEYPYPLPPENVNLIYNPSFTIGAVGEAGWRDIGSIVSNVTNPGSVMELSFPSVIDGWLRQYRLPYPLRSGLTMVAWVTVYNTTNQAADFQLMFQDNDLSNTYLCTFSVPPNAPVKTYYMRFKTATNWEIIRTSMRTNFVGANGLKYDDVNLRYRPWVVFPGNLECIPPTFDETPAPPPADELVTAPETTTTVTPTTTPTTTPTEVVTCSSLDWFNTDNWNGYLPTSEVQFVFDPFPESLMTGGIYDANGDGSADTLYDALSYGNSADQALLREAMIAMLNDRYDSNHPESWWAVEIDTAEAMAQGENAMRDLAARYALNNSMCQ